MTSGTTHRRRWPAAVAIAVAAIAVGAVFGTPHSGSAAAQAGPTNTTPPKISGTAQQGSTLTTDNGTWSDSSATFTYAWDRCDASGNACSAISGATAQTYQLQQADVGATIRVTVTATTSGGATQAQSAQTAVVSSNAAPANTAPPTISGTPQAGSTLTVANGTWSGSPTSFAYAWSRCDANGGTCAAISGATASTFQLIQADVGSTLRATVTATNANGSTPATTVPTAVITAAPAPTGCPASGTGVIQIADVSPPARLLIDQQTLTPGIVTASAKTIQARFRVTACGGRPVQGALVYATAVPYNQYSIPPEGTTGADGTATLTMNQLSGFPAARQQRLLVVFARARKPGESLLGGISSRRLVSFRVSLG